MKAILMSIKPQHVANILNGKKTIEIRKKFPSDYVGWVYIYCTKGNKNECLIADLQPDKVYHPLTEKLHRGVYSIVEEKAIWNDCKKYILNGKVVARFWCNKVEEISCRPICGEWECYTKTLGYSEIAKASCLENREIVHYLKGKNGYAIHITKLEIFDKPKEISEFYTTRLDQDITKLFDNSIQLENGTWVKPLTRAPESYCYIEIE